MLGGNLFVMDVATGRVQQISDIWLDGPPVWVAWLALFAIIGLCIWMLNKKIRAYEVVR